MAYGCPTRLLAIVCTHSPFTFSSSAPSMSRVRSALSVALSGLMPTALGVAVGLGAGAAAVEAEAKYAPLAALDAAEAEANEEGEEDGF